MLSGGIGVAALALLVVATSFLAGVFGMAGGMILMGALVWLMPVPAAMVLHGATQLASNGWRALLWWRYIDIRIVLRFTIGAAAALVLFSLILLVPDRATVLILLGIVPFLTFAVPERHAPHASRRWVAELVGFIGTGLQFLAGVSGPLLDSVFVRMPVDRRVVVASKAACQVVAHAMKLVYFGGIVAAGNGEGDVAVALVAMSMVLAIVGTTLARALLDRITDAQFRVWTKRIVLTVGAIYLVQGVGALLAR